MSNLRETQQQLAKLLTDEDARRQFLESQVSSTSSAVSIFSELDGIAAIELERAAETLFRKRRSQTKAMLPTTARTLGKEYTRLFRAFAVDHHFNGTNSIKMDAIAFSSWLRDQAAVSPWIAELAVWESLPIRWAMHEKVLKLTRFHYDIFHWIRQDESAMTEPRKANQWILTWRAYRFGEIHRRIC